MDSNTKPIKSLKSPVATSHTINNNSFQNISLQIYLEVIIKKHPIKHIGLPHPAIVNFCKSSLRHR